MPLNTKKNKWSKPRLRLSKISIVFESQDQNPFWFLAGTQQAQWSYKHVNHIISLCCRPLFSITFSLVIVLQPPWQSFCIPNTPPNSVHVSTLALVSTFIWKTVLACHFCIFSMKLSVSLVLELYEGFCFIALSVSKIAVFVVVMVSLCSLTRM